MFGIIRGTHVKNCSFRRSAKDFADVIAVIIDREWKEGKRVNEWGNIAAKPTAQSHRHNENSTDDVNKYTR